MGKNGDIEIVLADDHRILRETLALGLELEGDLRVVANVGDARAAVEAVAEKKPDVVVLDVEMPGDGIAKTARMIGKVSPGTRIVVLSMFGDPVVIHELLMIGIHGYLLKTAGREELAQAIRSVCLDPDRIMLLVPRESITQVPRRKEGTLSERELEILAFVAEGLSNSQIGSRLSITEGTVKRHLRNIFTKLGASSRTDAVKKATDASLLVTLVTAGRPASASPRPGGRGAEPH